MLIQLRKQKAWKRLVGAALIAGVMGGVCMQVVFPNPCKDLTPGDWQYWALSCWAMSSAKSMPTFVVLVR